ncbi:MAG: alpha-L-fucosidase [Acidobacteriaceae bacterium]|nr:alpha-L-fucosidase [Acidobacteriaceae bacterium]
MVSALFLLILVSGLLPGSPAQNVTDMKPSPQQLEWQDLEMGAIIHFGTNTFLDREWGDGTASPEVFNPKQVDTDQWMQAAKAAGIRYVVLVAKHHDGFTLWPSAQTDYGVKSSPWLGGKGDLVRMAAESARKYGLRFGVYLSPWDRHEPRYSSPAEYDKYYLAQLEELSTRYGPLEEFWLDGAGSEGRKYDFDTIIEHLRTYQPNTMVFADVALYKYADLRWVGTESGTVPFENWNVVDRAGYLRWRPVEADTPLHREQWFWHANADSTLKSLDELMDIYINTVGRGAQLMLGLAPDRTGRIPAADATRLTEFGAKVNALYGNNLALHHEPVDANAERALDGDANTFWAPTLDGSTPTLTVTFPRPQTFDRVMTMERLNDGQHVEEYSIEVLVDGEWRQIVRAYAIGHKKIDIFAPVTAKAVRLKLLETSGDPGIREFAVFNGQSSGR